MFKNKKNMKQITIDKKTYCKLYILLEEEGHENFSEVIEELLKK